MKQIIIAVLALGLLSCKEEVNPVIQDVLQYTVTYSDGTPLEDTLTIYSWRLDVGTATQFPDPIIVDSDSIINVRSFEEYWQDGLATSKYRNIDQGEPFVIGSHFGMSFINVDGGRLDLNIEYKDSIYFWSKPVKIVIL